MRSQKLYNHVYARLAQHTTVLAAPTTAMAPPMRQFSRVYCLIVPLLAALFLFGTPMRTSAAELSNLFTPLNLTAAGLSSEQRIIYDKAVAFGSYKTFQLVHTEPIATVQNQGKLSVSVDHAECPAYHFDNKNVEYKSPAEYYWYGELVYDDSSSNCSKGSLMMLSNERGEQYGHLELENRTFEVIDLTGGVQLIAQVDYNATSGHTCGTMDAQNSGAKNTNIISRAEAGLACNQRVLLVFTPYAALTDPMGFNRGLLAFAQAKQAMLNSGVSKYRINLLLSIAYVPYVEDRFNQLGIDHKGISTDLHKMYNDPILSSDISALKSQYKADIVMLFVMNNPADPAAGVANQSDAPLYNYQYGVVQTGFSTAAGYSFAHELGHLLGARHSNDGVLDADMTPAISHAHRWTWTTNTGTWLWRKAHHHSAKSITYQSTAGDNSVILGYSTPLVSNDGVVHGIAADRDAAQEFRNVGCMVADYNNAPDDFTVTIGPDAPVNTAGRHIYCRKVDNHELTAYVTGPVGVYQYLWEFSSSGISNWQNAGTGRSLPLSIFYNGIMHVRLTVTPPTGVGSPNTVYYVLETTNDCDAGWAFRPGETNTENPPALKTHLMRISPNPTVADIDVQYELDHDGEVTISLYDMQGRLVKTLQQSETAGGHKITFNTTGTATGTYMLRLTAGHFNESRIISIRH